MTTNLSDQTSSQPAPDGDPDRLDRRVLLVAGVFLVSVAGSVLLATTGRARAHKLQ